MSYKKRSKEEVKAIVDDYENGMALSEVCAKYEISGTAFHRLLRDYRGLPAESKKAESKIKKLEKIIAQRDLEIKLMKAALKKS